MLNRIIASVFCFFIIVTAVFFGLTALYFALPSKTAQATITLPSYVEDSPTLRADSIELQEASSGTTYLADVYQSLTLREYPQASSNELASLTPMTHLTLLEDMSGTDYVYVEVTTGQYTGYKGYVNKEYITPLGEQTIRVNSN